MTGSVSQNKPFSPRVNLGMVKERLKYEILKVILKYKARVRQPGQHESELTPKAKQVYLKPFLL